MARMFALVVSPPEPRTRHFEGGPSASDRVGLPLPAVVVLDETAEGFFLIRWADDGTFGGDTYHQTADEARGQAEFEFEHVGTWEAIPADITDPAAYAIARARLG